MGDAGAVLALDKFALGLDGNMNGGGEFDITAEALAFWGD